MRCIGCSVLSNVHSFSTVVFDYYDQLPHIAAVKCVRTVTERYRCLESFLKGATKVIFKAAGMS